MTTTDRIDPAYGTETTINGSGPYASERFVPLFTGTTTQFVPRLMVSAPELEPPAFDDLWPTIKHAASSPKWKPIMTELARRLHAKDPSAVDYAINKSGRLDIRPLDYVGSRSSGWTEYRDPDQARAALDMVVAPIKPAPTPRKVAAPKVDGNCHERFAAKQALATQAPEPQKPEIPTSSLPTWAEEWLAGLVFETKRDYARQFLAHLLCDAPAPECPGTEWAEKARKRARRLTELAA